MNFWGYVAKLKNIIDNVGQRAVMTFDGADFVRFLREGQELISSIKLSTLNKRFLVLCEEVNKQIDPYLKCAKLFIFMMSGS